MTAADTNIVLVMAFYGGVMLVVMVVEAYLFGRRSSRRTAFGRGIDSNVVIILALGALIWPFRLLGLILKLPLEIARYTGSRAALREARRQKAADGKSP